MLAAFDAGDMVMRAAASGLDPWWSAWLQASSFHEEVQTKLENLPYAGENLFGEQVGATLQTAKERQAKMCFLRSLSCPSAPCSRAGRGKLLYISWLSHPLFQGCAVPFWEGCPTTVAEQGALHPPLYRQQQGIQRAQGI